jgi:Tfp pilus assembly protein PilN
MKLQFNLLPDVKQEYLKTRHTKRTIITASIVASAIALFIFLFATITVYVINKNQLSRADSDIKKYSNDLQSVKNLDKILTIQNQLSSIQSLHQGKHKMSRIYTYLPQVTPAHVCVSQLSLDGSSSSLNFQGTAESQKSINTFVDTLKFTKYKVGKDNATKDAFPSVVENQFGISTSATTQEKGSGSVCQGAPAPAGYQLSVKFDPALFANASDVQLVVPQGLVTTRSVLNDPSNIFNGDPSAIPAQPTSNTKPGGQ